MRLKSMCTTCGASWRGTGAHHPGRGLHDAARRRRLNARRAPSGALLLFVLVTLVACGSPPPCYLADVRHELDELLDGPPGPGGGAARRAAGARNRGRRRRTSSRTEPASTRRHCIGTRRKWRSRCSTKAGWQCARPTRRALPMIGRGPQRPDRLHHRADRRHGVARVCHPRRASATCRSTRLVARIARVDSVGRAAQHVVAAGRWRCRCSRWPRGGRCARACAPLQRLRATLAARAAQRDCSRSRWPTLRRRWRRCSTR